MPFAISQNGYGGNDNLAALVGPDLAKYRTTNSLGLSEYMPQGFGDVNIGGGQYNVRWDPTTGKYIVSDKSNEHLGSYVYGADGKLENWTPYNDGNAKADFGMFLASALTMGAAGMAGAATGAAADSGGAIGGGLLGDATAAGYGGLDAAGAASMGGGASVAGGSALGVEGIGGIAGASTAVANGASTPWYEQLYDGAKNLVTPSPGGSSPFSIEGALRAVAPSLISGGASLIGGAMGANAAKDAAGIQAGAAQSGIDETRRQFDTVQQLLSPYVEAGKRGLAGYEGLAGTMGAPAQQQALTDLQATPMWASTVRSGEDAILQNVAATGGLRGGNVQDALAKFRAGLLTDQVNQQLQRYGSLATMGQNSAAGVGSAALTSGGNIAQLLQQQGAANAGGVLAGNRAIVNTIGGLGGMYAANGAPSGFSLPTSMTPSAVQAGVSQTGMGSSGFGTGLAYGNQDLGAYF